jgi:hypothetical protein
MFIVLLYSIAAMYACVFTQYRVFSKVKMSTKMTHVGPQTMLIGWTKRLSTRDFFWKQERRIDTEC